MGEDLVHGVLRQRARQAPDRVWLRFVDGGSFTYADLWSATLSVTRQLRDLGVKKGDRVAVLLPNCVEFVASWFATHSLGAICVPLNLALRGDTLRHTLDLTKPRALIGSTTEFRSSESVYQEAEALQSFLFVGERHSGTAFDEQARLSLEVESSSDDLIDENPPEANDPCCILLTSGTTGPSKGCTWTHAVTEHVCRTTVDNMRYTDADVLYTCLPLFHSNALHISMYSALLADAPIVVSERFSARRFWGEVRRSGATATNLLGAMTPILLRTESPDEKLHSLRRALVIPCPEEYYEVLPQRFGFHPVEAYGLTDVGMPLWSPPNVPARPGSCGKPTDGFECQIVDEKDNPVPPGTTGEFVCRPTKPWITPPGYWESPEVTVAAWRNLWIHTGDLMEQDSDGWYYFIDRAKDSIRRRGENVSSFEVEQAFLRHPAISECAAYALPSDLLEDEVAVALVLSDDVESPPAIPVLLKFVEEHLPYFAIPRYVRVLASLPKTQTEKVQKRILREAGETEDIWDRETTDYEVRR